MASGSSISVKSGRQQPFFIAGWRVDPSLHVISRGNTTTHLEPKVMQVLVVLAEHAGQVVSKEELINVVWGGAFVSDQIVTNAICDLRQAFGASREPGFIQTIPKGGYRLTAAVGGAPPASDQRAGPDVSPPAVASWRAVFRGRRWQPTVAFVLLLLLLLVAFKTLRQRLMPPAEPEIKSLAVLPLANLSGDPAQEYFVDGMTEELITELSSIKTLRVISRTSAMSYKNTSKKLPEIARELGVDAIVEGAVMRAGDRVRITAQLIHASDQHLWSNRYESELRDIFGLQAAVGRDIAQRIKATLSTQEGARRQTRPPVNPAAYEAYLKGRFYAAKLTASAMPKALKEFRRATEIDPNYAVAHAGLAWGYYISSILCAPRCLQAREYMARAKASAATALQLDGTLAEAHAMLGMARWFDEWDWSAPEAELRRALELNPNSVEVLMHQGSYLSWNGRHAEAIAVLERVLAQDPLSLEARLLFGGTILRHAGQYDRGIEQLQEVLELDPNSRGAYDRLANLYDLKGMHAEAINAALKAQQLTGLEPAAMAALRRAAAEQGYEGVLRFQIQQIRLDHGPASALASKYARLGERDQAFLALEQAYRDHESGLLRIAVDPYFSKLRTDPRFSDLLRRIGLPQ